MSKTIKLQSACERIHASDNLIKIIEKGRESAKRMKKIKEESLKQEIVKIMALLTFTSM